MTIVLYIDRRRLNQQYNTGIAKSTIHRNVRSKDWIDLGNVIPESGDTFTVMQGASSEYNIPKCVMQAFDGSELLLSIPFSEVLSYKAT
jgi:hypothetical protein